MSGSGVMLGGDGNDRASVQAATRLDMGSGADTVSASAYSGQINVTLGTGADVFETYSEGSPGDLEAIANGFGDGRIDTGDRGDRGDRGVSLVKGGLTIDVAAIFVAPDPNYVFSDPATIHLDGVTRLTANDFLPLA